jgi:uncharacterized protein (TIGR02186 family)
MKKLKIISVIFLMLFSLKAHASYLVADLSAHDIVLNYNFKGQYITISGIVDDVEDIIIIVEGPVRSYKIWKKEKIKGIWVKSKSYVIPSEPSYFYIAASKNIYEIANLDNLRRLKLDYKFNELQSESSYSIAHIKEFKEEFKLYKQSLSLYPFKVDTIERISNNIFRSKFFIPAYAYNGAYEVKIYAFKKGQMVNSAKLYFEVVKQGLYAEIDEISRTQPLKYGVISVIIALLAGATAGFIFRKDR